MNARKSLLAIATTAALAISGLSYADSYWHPATGERGYSEYPDHLKGTQSASIASSRSAGERRNAVSADGFYRYAGPETGWQLIPHSYVFKGGHIVHTDNFGHDVSRPSVVLSADEKRQLSRMNAGG